MDKQNKENNKIELDKIVADNLSILHRRLKEIEYEFNKLNTQRKSVMRPTYPLLDALNIAKTQLETVISALQLEQDVSLELESQLKLKQEEAEKQLNNLNKEEDMQGYHL